MIASVCVYVHLKESLFNLERHTVGHNICIPYLACTCVSESVSRVQKASSWKRKAFKSCKRTRFELLVVSQNYKDQNYVQEKKADTGTSFLQNAYIALTKQQNNTNYAT